MKFRINVVAIFLAVLTVIGCGSHEAQVSGRVTCQGKAVVGSILFSPKGEGQSNTGPSVPVPLNEDGRFEVRLKTIGMHILTVTPRDVKFPVPAGEFDYPCDRSPVEREVRAGQNDITLELAVRK